MKVVHIVGTVDPAIYMVQEWNSESLVLSRYSSRVSDSTWVEASRGLIGTLEPKPTKKRS
jgi:hypothetical protein